MAFLLAHTKNALQEYYTPRQLAIAQNINPLIGRKATPGLISSWTTPTTSAVHEPTTTSGKSHRLTLCGGRA